MQRILVPLFTFIWWKSLHNAHPYYPDKLHRVHVCKVKGWRTAIIDGFGGQRMTITIMFWWDK